MYRPFHTLKRVPSSPDKGSGGLHSWFQRSSKTENLCFYRGLEPRFPCRQAKSLYSTINSVAKKVHRFCTAEFRVRRTAKLVFLHYSTADGHWYAAWYEPQLPPPWLLLRRYCDAPRADKPQTDCLCAWLESSRISAPLAATLRGQLHSFQTYRNWEGAGEGSGLQANLAHILR